MKEGMQIPVKQLGINTSAETSKRPDMEDIRDVMSWFKEVGDERFWIFDGRQDLLYDRLSRFSSGMPTDFLIWNCIKFNWVDKSNGSYPGVILGNNLNASRTLYYKDRIREVTQRLSILGNPNITVLVPTNEAFDTRTWDFLQTYEEREKIISESVDGLRIELETLPLPQNAGISVQRWDEYLQSRNVLKLPEMYSIEGAALLSQRNNYEKMMKKATTAGIQLFKNENIAVSAESVRAQRALYYGIYAGEGIAFEEMQQQGRNIVIINLEEMRPPTRAYEGANENLCIITPIKNPDRKISKDE